MTAAPSRASTAPASPEPAPDPPPVPAPATALEKGLAVLEHTAIAGRTTPAKISQELGLSRSATYRLVDRLASEGWLDPVPDGFRLGPRAMMLGVAAMGQTELLQIAPPDAAIAGGPGRHTVNLAVPDGNFMTYVAQEEGPEAVRATARLGTRRPLNCSGLGKAYLATLPRDELAERLQTMPFIRLTARSIMDAATLSAELDRVRERGYALDDLEVEEGVGCVAAAVRDFRGRTVAAISVAGPVERIRASTQTIAAELLHTTSQLSTRLGYLP